MCAFKLQKPLLAMMVLNVRMQTPLHTSPMLQVNYPFSSCWPHLIPHYYWSTPLILHPPPHTCDPIFNQRKMSYAHQKSSWSSTGLTVALFNMEGAFPRPFSQTHCPWFMIKNFSTDDIFLLILLPVLIKKFRQPDLLSLIGDKKKFGAYCL